MPSAKRLDLEDFPLAKEYGWKKPKVDTGGIFYLFPIVPHLKVDRKGVDTDFWMIKRARVGMGLIPDEFNITFRDNGDPYFQNRNWRPERNKRKPDLS